jgi:salicylate hydroxylase
MEDAASLATALSLISSKEQIPEALKLYEKVRKTRAEEIQQSADQTRTALHLPDGEEQRKRDVQMKCAEEAKGKSPDLWSDDAWQRFMWGTDVVRDTVEEWGKMRADKAGPICSRL